MSRRSQTGWVGIDWGTRAIKLVSLERSGTDFRFVRKAILRRQVEIPATGAELDLPAWGCDDFPAGLIRDAYFSRKKGACVLPMHLADIRPMELPAMDDSVRRSMVAGELADTFGEEVGARVFDWWESDGGAGARGAHQLQVFSMPRGLAMSVTEAMSRAGLDCEVIDALPFALGRALVLGLPPDEAPRVALDWGFSGAIVSVYRGSVPLYTRPLRGCGLVRILDSLMSSLGIALAEAEQLLVDAGLPGAGVLSPEMADLRQLLAEIVEDPLHHLVEQLDKTLLYVESEWPGCLSDRLWFFGGAATIRNMDVMLGGRIGLSVTPWTLPEQMGDRQPTDVLFAAAAALSALAWTK